MLNDNVMLNVNQIIMDHSFKILFETVTFSTDAVFQSLVDRVCCGSQVADIALQPFSKQGCLQTVETFMSYPFLWLRTEQFNGRRPDEL